MTNKKRGPAPSGNISKLVRIYPENQKWYEGLSDKSATMNELMSKARNKTKPS